MKLPLLQSRNSETTLCSYCPKLCRPACPVSTAEGRETVTPWGKMRSAGFVARGVLPATKEHLAPAWACTGCMGCRQLCELDNPVADTLRDARSDAWESGLAPTAITEFLAKKAARAERLATQSKEVFSGISQENASTVFFPGCTSVVTQPEKTRAFAQWMGEGSGGVRVEAEQCCGLPLLEAGAREEFRGAARSLSARLQHAKEVVVSDPGCAHAMRVFYPREGIAIPRVLHVSEWIEERGITVVSRGEINGAVVYHDACRLGRGLGVYDPPRKILERVLGRPVRELPYHHQHGACSGGGGLLPVTSPETSADIANDLAALVRESEASLVVSACATTVRKLRKAGVNAVEFGAFVAGLAV